MGIFVFVGPTMGVDEAEYSGCDLPSARQSR